MVKFLERVEEKINKEDVVGMECKHAVYIKADPSDYGAIPDDLAFVKEVVHLKDGRRIPRTRRLVNFKRPFYITKPGFRKHKEKKEWEDLEKLDKFECTQAEMVRAIKRALNIVGNVHTLKKLGRSPYLYGSDITSTALIKRWYQDTWPGVNSPNQVAVLDLETDVVKGTDDPIYGSVTFKKKAILVATHQFAGHIENFEERMREYYYKRVAEIEQIASREIELEVVMADSPLELIQILINRCHVWMPDFVAIWNMNFDIPRILDTIAKYGGDAGDIFSDPSVPPKFRKAHYKEGPAKKIAASGREEALHWVDRWHTLHAPASFYVIDQACVFRKLRVAKGREPSYALDAILQKHTDVRKLKNEKADQMAGLEWHVYMQKHEPFEYGVYNLVDCITCEILDEQPKVGDLRVSISMQCGHSDYDKFPSQPRRSVDDLHFKCLSLGKVIASTPDDIETEFDKLTVTIKNWIITLPAHLVVDNGITAIEECPDLRTLIRIAVYDLDVSSAYPTGEDVLNCSKETTVAERVKVKGVEEQVIRNAGINLTAGTVNAAEIVCSVMKAPTFTMLLDDFEKNELGVTIEQ